MTTILHTADLHLKKTGDERWQALEEVLAAAKQKKVDALTIAGDLFDQDVRSYQLRDKLRGLFSVQPYQVIILPGNHDANSYEAGLYFGRNVKIIQNPQDQIDLDDTVFYGIPFAPMSPEKLASTIKQINQQLDPNKANILLFHGELTDLFFSSADYGEEGNKRYLPLSLNLFANTSFDYVLAGHFHTKFHLKKLPNQRLKQGGYFLYPGSPVSITTKEVEPRSVALISAGEEPAQITLATHYYQPIEFEINPTNQPKHLEQLANQLAALPPNAKGLLTIKGFFRQDSLQLTEVQLKEKMQALANQYSCELADNQFQVKDVSSILDSGLYQAFLEQLEIRSLSEVQKQELLKIYVEALTQ